MLDIPFQEVRKAAVTFHNGSPGNGRRLAERWATVQAASLSIASQGKGVI